MLLALLVMLQQPQPVTPVAPPSPIARVVISPLVRSLTAGDTLRLTAQPLDSAGQPVPNATVRFVGSGGRFEGRVDTTGLVTAGSTGTLGVSAVASVPGSRPMIERVEIRMLPGPATRLVIAPEGSRLVSGQRVLLEAHAFSAAGDARADVPRWRSSASRVATVTQDGLVTAVSAGRATISARVDGAEKTTVVEVLATSIGLWKAQRLGESSLSAWENMQNVLLDMGLLSKALDLTKVYTNQFLP